MDNVLVDYYSNDDLNHAWWLLRTLRKDHSLDSLLCTLMVRHPSMCSDHVLAVMNRARDRIMSIINNEYELIPKVTIF